jgi:hypothetical protein
VWCEEMKFWRKDILEGRNRHFENVKIKY